MTDSDSDSENGSLLPSNANSGAERAERGSSHWSFRSIKRFIKSCGAHNSYIFHSAMLFFIIIGLLLVVMWDLEQVHNISEIIHDDHSSLWEKMNDSAIKSWLSPLDLCLLSAPDGVQDLKAYRTANCSKLPSYNSPTVQRLFCSIGSSLGKQCSPPLSEHSYFTQRLVDPHYRNANNKYLFYALRALARKRMPLIFIGDGLSKQNQDALICEAMKQDRILVQGIQSDYVIRWRDEKSLPPLEVRYLPLDYIGEEEEGQAEGPLEGILDLFGGRKRRRRRRRRLNTTLPLSAHIKNTTLLSPSPMKGKKGPPAPASASASALSASKGGSEITFLSSDASLSISRHDLFSPSNTGTGGPNATFLLPSAQYNLSYVMSQISPYLSQNRSVAIVANAGVWYNSREKFRRELPPLLDYLVKLSSSPAPLSNIVLYRETAAQHWNHTVHGYYEAGEGEEIEGECVPMADSTPELDWRNTDLYHLLTNSQQELKIIPFREVTSALHDMHPSLPSVPDCTHFCYFPQMWTPVWFALYNETRGR